MSITGMGNHGAVGVSQNAGILVALVSNKTQRDGANVARRASNDATHVWFSDKQPNTKYSLCGQNVSAFY